MRMLAGLTCVLLLLLLLSGCRRGKPALAPVNGQVFYRGKPLEAGTIVFTPDPERGGSGPQARAVIGEDGRYSLRTEGRMGATPGWHRITIANTKTAPRRLPGRYRDPELSEQRFEVK